MRLVLEASHGFEEGPDDGHPASDTTFGVVTDAREFLSSLKDQQLQTVTGRPNRVIDLIGDQVLVATTRSPKGQPVPIAWIQSAIDRLERDRDVEISVPSVGHRSAFVGAVLRELPGAEVVRETSPPRVRLRSGG